MKKKISLKLLSILGIALVFAASFYIGNFLAGSKSKETEAKSVKVDREKEKELNIDQLNVLLMGIDARPGESAARTDTMILASFDKESGKIAMLSIPRDTLVEIPNHGERKINEANEIGGPEMAIQVVEDLVDVEIPYYVKTNFDGFKDIVDTLGGVTIDVEKNMYYRDRNDVISLKKGEQRLDGEKALQYVRYRHDALGDITRTGRQQKFLEALAEETLQAKTIIKLPKLVPQILDVVDTNFGVKDTFLLTKLASSFKAENIVAQTLPGTFYDYKGISYWKANEKKAKLVINDMLQGITTAAVIDAPIIVPKEEPKDVEETEEGQEGVPEESDDTKDNSEAPPGTETDQDNNDGSKIEPIDNRDDEQGNTGDKVDTGKTTGDTNTDVNTGDNNTQPPEDERNPINQEGTVTDGQTETNPVEPINTSNQSQTDSNTTNTNETNQIDETNNTNNTSTETAVPSLKDTTAVQIKNVTETL